jgi:enamine deaminase RidA (YjgF/YER057c/UK114 family)
VKWRVVNPEGLDPPRGFSHGLLAPAGGRLLFVAGQAPTAPDGGVVAGGFVAQFTHALRKIVRVVEEAGGTAQNIGRLTIFVADIREYRRSRAALGAAYREIMGDHYPAMALVEVAALLDEHAVIEIEATAVIAEKE